MFKTMQKNYGVLPVIYLFATIFLLRHDVILIYIASAVFVILTLVLQYRQKLPPLHKLAQWMVVLSVIGISSAVILSIEKVDLLSQADHIASCSLNPIVTCSPVIKSAQSSAFGFPNPFIGIFGFTAVFTAAMTILAGADKLLKSWWRTLLGGIAFGSAFCAWLLYQGVFVIGKLCLYCLLVWLVTFGLLWLVTAYCVEAKQISFGKHLNKLVSFKYELIAATYVVIFAIILFRWADYWSTLLH